MSATKRSTLKYSWTVYSYFGYHESPQFGLPASPIKFQMVLTIYKRNSDLELRLLEPSTITELDIECRVKISGGRLVEKQLSKKLFNKPRSPYDCFRLDGGLDWPHIFQHAGIVIIDCEITYADPFINLKLDHREQLVRDIASLRNAQFSDIKLVTTQDGQEFSAHKAILSARSPVFAAMFSHEELSECQEGQVEIPDVSGEVMRLLLDYIYSGEIVSVDGKVDEVFQVADKYDIKPLIGTCIEKMMANIEVNNAAKFLHLADLYQLESLKVQALEFITNHSKEVRQTTGWKEYITPALMEQLLAFAAEKQQGHGPSEQSKKRKCTGSNA